MANYTVIHGNVIYKVENVQYKSTDTHRTFKRGDKLILSVPNSAILIADGEGVTAKLVNGLTTGPGINPPDNKTTNIQSGGDGFAEGAVVGGLAGALLF